MLDWLVLIANAQKKWVLFHTKEANEQLAEHFFQWKNVILTLIYNDLYI